jgi:hypothetical protein
MKFSQKASSRYFYLSIHTWMAIMLLMVVASCNGGCENADQRKSLGLVKKKTESVRGFEATIGEFSSEEVIIKVRSSAKPLQVGVNELTGFELEVNSDQEGSGAIVGPGDLKLLPSDIQADGSIQKTLRVQRGKKATELTIIIKKAGQEVGRKDVQVPALLVPVYQFELSKNKIDDGSLLVMAIVSYSKDLVSSEVEKLRLKIERKEGIEATLGGLESGNFELRDRLNIEEDTDKKKASVGLVIDPKADRKAVFELTLLDEHGQEVIGAKQTIAWDRKRDIQLAFADDPAVPTASNVASYAIKNDGADTIDPARLKLRIYKEHGRKEVEIEGQAIPENGYYDIVLSGQVSLLKQGVPPQVLQLLINGKGCNDVTSRGVALRLELLYDNQVVAKKSILWREKPVITLVDNTPLTLVGSNRNFTLQFKNEGEIWAPCKYISVAIQRDSRHNGYAYKAPGFVAHHKNGTSQPMSTLFDLLGKDLLEAGETSVEVPMRLEDVEEDVDFIITLRDGDDIISKVDRKISWKKDIPKIRLVESGTKVMLAPLGERKVFTLTFKNESGSELTPFDLDVIKITLEPIEAGQTVPSVQFSKDLYAGLSEVVSGTTTLGGLFPRSVIDAYGDDTLYKIPAGAQRSKTFTLQPAGEDSGFRLKLASDANVIGEVKVVWGEGE